MMPDEQIEQPPRNKTVTAAVTLDEKRALSLVATARLVSESEVLRDMTMADIVAEAGRIREAMTAAVAAAAPSSDTPEAA